MERYFCRIDKHSARFLKMLDDSIEMRRFEATLGKIEVHDSHEQMSPSDVLDHIEQASQHGFREVSAKESDDEQIKLRADLERMIIEPTAPMGRVVPWDDLEGQYRPYFRNNPAELLSPDLRFFCVRDQPCHLSGDLTLKFDSIGPTAQTLSRNLIFNDGLTIDGNFDAGDCTTELPLLVIVKGDLHVNNLILSGWAELIVTGNVVVADTVYGFDGEAGGRLLVQGNLSARRILGEMMYSIEVAGQVTGSVYWSDLDEPTLANASIVPHSISSEQAIHFGKYTPLVSEAYYAESNWATGEEVQTFILDPPQIVERIRQGKSIFR